MRSTQVTDSCEPRVPGEAKRFGGRRGHIRMQEKRGKQALWAGRNEGAAPAEIRELSGGAGPEWGYGDP